MAPSSSTRTDSRSPVGLVIAIDLAAAACLAAMLVGFPSTDLGTLAALVLAGGLAGVVSVRLPKKQAHLAPTEPFLLAGMGLAGPWSAPAVAVAAAIATALLRRSRFLQTSFNLGAAVLAGGAAGVAFTFCGGMRGAPASQLVVPIFAAAIVFSIVNGALVAGVLAVVQRRSWGAAWSDVFLGAAVANLAAPLLALALFTAIDAGVVWLLALVLPVLVVARALLRGYAEQVRRVSRGSGVSSPTI